MPKGSPTPQTIASDKYQKKAGYMTKGFKLKKELVDSYISACEKAGVTPTAKIRELMNDFISEVNNQ